MKCILCKREFYVNENKVTQIGFSFSISKGALRDYKNTQDLTISGCWDCYLKAFGVKKKHILSLYK